jgi:phosphosulfolactate synthase (CoM biosynthesis protein A)
MLLLVLLAAAFAMAADLKEIQNEPNLERRAKLALDHAEESFTRAKADYAAGKRDSAGDALRDMQAAVEMARDALNATGKNARRHTGPFKSAETVTRDLLRKLDGLYNSMDYDDRKQFEAPKAKVQEIHDQWLEEIISGKHADK